MIPEKKGGGIGGITIWDRWDHYLGSVGSVLGIGGITTWDRVGSTSGITWRGGIPKTINSFYVKGET